MKLLLIFRALIVVGLFANYAHSCCMFKKMNEDIEDHEVSHEPKFCVVSIQVSPLPGSYTVANISLPNSNDIIATQSGGTFILKNKIDVRADQFSFARDSSLETKLGIWFDRDQAFKSTSDIFADITSPGFYQLRLSFEKFQKDHPWSVTVKNVLDLSQ